MDQDFKITIEVAVIVIALSFVIQAAMFIFIYVAIRRLTAIATSVQAKVEPLVEQAQGTIKTVTSTVEKINAQAKETFDKVTVETRAVAAAVSVSSQEITKLAHHQAEQISATLDQAATSLQRQIAEYDRLLARTHDRIEYTTLEVQSSVLDPVRELSALLVGIRRTIEALVKRDRKQIDKAYQDEEMFI